MAGEDGQDAVAVDDLSPAIGQDAAVGVAVEGDAQVGGTCHHGAAEEFGVSRAAA